MFALLIHQCTAEKRGLVGDIALNFVLFAVDWYTVRRPWRTMFAWAKPGETWEHNFGAPDSRAETVASVLEHAVQEKRALVGLNYRVGDSGAAINVGDNFTVVSQQGGILSAESNDSTLALSAKRMRAPVWFGWYRDEGIDLVLVHDQRRAIEASTGRCGCLFDEHLQLWLVESHRLAIHELGSKSVKVVRNGSQEKASRTGP